VERFVSIDIVDDLLASDGVRPEQFSDMWSARVERSGEQLLALAVLEQAVEDLGRFRDARRADQQRLFDQTYRWLTSNDRSWPYSFTSICETLELAPDPIRSRLLMASRDTDRPTVAQVRAEASAIVDDAQLVAIGRSFA
jgi:hypothetical protein